MNNIDELPSKKWIEVPKGGWEAQSWYLVHLSLRKTNPIFECLFFTGFLEYGKPSGYSGATPTNYIERIDYNQIYFMKIIKKLEL